MGVVGWYVYVTSPGRPTDIGLQLGKTCYPCITGKGRGGNVFISSVSLLSFLVGLCVYVTSPERPTDIGLQLGKACYPCSR